MGDADPLVSCLAYLTRYFESPRSIDVIRASLGLTDDALSEAAFSPAAAKLNLIAEKKQLPLDAIEKNSVPAVLMMKSGAPCIVIDTHRSEALSVVRPGTSDPAEPLDRARLEADYSGWCFAVRQNLEQHFSMPEAERAPAPWPAWFFKAFAPHWWTYSQVILAALMINLFALASPLFIMNVYDRVLPNNSIPSLWVMTLGIVIVFGFDFLVKNLRSFFVDHAGRRIDVHLAGEIADRVLDMQIREKPASSGEYANMLRELESLRDFFTSATLLSVVDLPFIFIFILIFYLLAGPLALVLVTTLVLIILLGLLFHFPLQKAVFKSYHQGHKKHSILVETVSNLETIKCLRAEGRFRKKWQQAVLASSASGARSRFLSQFVMNAAALFQQLAYVSIVVFGVYLIRDGRITTGALVACVILNGRAMAPLAQVVMLLTRLHHAYSALKGLNRMMHKPVERPDDRQFLHRPDLKSQVEFRQVTFSYPGSMTAALDTVSFIIRPGEKVGVIGRSGSGKTTLGKLLLGLYPLDSGSIRIDQVDIGQLDPIDIRGIAGMVPQDVVLFQGTIRENILITDPRAGDSAMLEAADISGVDDFLRHHPMGYDLQVSERGDGLSGGQRQAIGIARALVHSPALLIMDEPTSAMDNTSEMIFKQRFAPYVKERTLIMITHKISMLDLVDRLIVMDGGRVVADGPKQVVLQNLSQKRIEKHR